MYFSPANLCLNVLIAILISVLMQGSLGSRRTLKFVLEVSRHGSRAPTSRSFDYGDTMDYPNGLSNLTEEGQIQQYLIGRHLRNYLVHEHGLLKEVVSPHDVRFLSTDKMRAVESAQFRAMGLQGIEWPFELAGSKRAVLASMPPFEIKETEQNIQRILSSKVPNVTSSALVPIEVRDRFKDRLLHPHSACLKLKRLNKSHQDSLDTLNWVVNNIGEKAKIVGKWTNKKPSLGDYKGFDRFFGQVQCAVWHDRELPPDVAELSSLATEFKTYKQYNVFNADKEQTKLGVAEFYAETREMFDKVVNNKLREKFIHFATHDTTLSYILTSLGIKNSPIYFGSSLFFEIYKNEDNGDFEIQIKFNDDIITLKKLDCNICPLSAFLRFAKKHLISNLRTRCGDVDKYTQLPILIVTIAIIIFINIAVPLNVY